MTGKHLGAAMAVAAGLVLANAQNWASAEDTTNEQREANEQLQNQAEQRTTNEATQRQGQTGEYGSDDREWNDQQRDSQQRDRQQQNDQQWNDEQQRDQRQGENRNRERQGDRQQQGDRRWNDQGRDRQSDIRFDRSEREGREGLVIAGIVAGTPYYRSGLREGDVIVSLNGQPLRSADEFYRWSDRGGRVPVVILRNGQRETIYIQHDGNRSDSRSYAENTGTYQAHAFLGVRFEMRFRNGAVISEVVPGSPAEDAGLKAGDELVAINGRQVDSPREVTRVVESMQPGDRIDIEFARRMEQQTQAVLEEHPRALASAQYQRGENYDRGVEQSSYDDEGSYEAPDEYNRNGSGYRPTERSGERRGGRILPRLRD